MRAGPQDAIRAWPHPARGSRPPTAPGRRAQTHRPGGHSGDHGGAGPCRARRRPAQLPPSPATGTRGPSPRTEGLGGGTGRPLGRAGRAGQGGRGASVAAMAAAEGRRVGDAGGRAEGGWGTCRRAAWWHPASGHVGRPWVSAARRGLARPRPRLREARRPGAGHSPVAGRAGREGCGARTALPRGREPSAPGKEWRSPSSPHRLPQVPSVPVRLPRLLPCPPRPTQAHPGSPSLPWADGAGGGPFRSRGDFPELWGFQDPARRSLPRSGDGSGWSEAPAEG